MENSKKQDLDFEIQFLEGVLKHRPDFEQALMALGDAYTKKERFAEGLLIDRRLSHLRPDDPLVHYNLSCSYALLGEVDNALAAIKQAIHLGYRDFSFLEQDPDLENLLKDRRFKEFFSDVKNKQSLFNS